ncbi:MAG: hypothetical protein KDA89_19205, partial [Planctomycetaceae bacterium]|nr:hypothetical protein [Planctomycetaceae bacterium]
ESSSQKDEFPLQKRENRYEREKQLSDSLDGRNPELQQRFVNVAAKRLRFGVGSRHAVEAKA